MLFEEDDDLPRVKMGRFTDADERIVQGIMGRKRWWGRASNGSVDPKRQAGRRTVATRDLGLVRRAHVIERGYNLSVGKQAVVVNKSTPKSVSGVMNALRYAARTRPEDKREDKYTSVSAWDGFHVPVSAEDIERIPETWDLIPDEDNLSKPARQLLEEGNFQALQVMKLQKRLHHIQARHYVFSIEENGDDEEIEEKLRVAVYLTVDDIFTAQGHRTIWTIHREDTDHLHAHVVVRTLSDFGGRLYSDIHGDFLHNLRLSFAGHLQSVGLNYTASRKVDRRTERESIMAGHTALHQNRAPWMAGDGEGGAYGKLQYWPSVFGKHAVANIERLDAVRAIVRKQAAGLGKAESIAMATRTFKELLNEPPEQPSWLKAVLGKWVQGKNDSKISPEYRELFEVLQAMYHDPVTALSSWQLMAIDGMKLDKQGRLEFTHRRLANWTLLCRPEYLGAVKSDAYLYADNKRLKQILRKTRPPQSIKIHPSTHIAEMFIEFHRKKRVYKDRSNVVGELTRLNSELEQGWQETWYVDVVRKAVRQTRKIAVGYGLSRADDLRERTLNEQWRFYQMDSALDGQATRRRHGDQEFGANEKIPDPLEGVLVPDDQTVGRLSKKRHARKGRGR